jgi:MFS superfamily sulfate permease-like transporter
LETVDSETYRVNLTGAAVFSNFIGLKSEMSTLPDGKTIIFDLSGSSLIDHTVMEFIDHFREDYIERGGRCEIHGLDHHEPYSKHPLAARRQPGSTKTPEKKDLAA